MLVMVTLPLTPVFVEGVKLTLSDAVCPGARICPVDTPLAPKPAPEILTLEMVTLAVPELVTVVGMVEFAPMAMVPNVKLEGFTVSPIRVNPDVSGRLSGTCYLRETASSLLQLVAQITPLAPNFF